ncbi:MAG: hypothetical protein QOD86_1030 [Miltoncostaeaceae bacterium]|jgi:hypothetical protein|nr:hypothetical protein [Miltoncostaeaceae bacterium]
MRWFLMVATLVAALAVMMTAMAVADPNLPNIGAHRHYVISPNGTYREVGPDLCDHPGNAGIQNAFNQFHANVHRGIDGASIGPVAPGLHNGRGAEITAVGGCGSTPPTQ